MSEAPYVPFYTSDFLGGTSGMTAATRGVYITLLCLMYEAEAPLPQSWETLARRCGCTLPAFRKAIGSLEDDGKVTVSDAGLWSPKCDRHIAQRRERQSSATAAAKKRWQKDKEKQCGADAAAPSAQCQPEPEPKEEYSVANATDGEAVPDDFAKQLFDRAVAYLGRHGTPDRQARAIVGRWRKDHADRDIFEAFSDCARAGVVDPIPWITARLRPSNVTPFRPQIDLSKFNDDGSMKA